MTDGPRLSNEARELELYADNSAALYPQKCAITKNLCRKKKRGTYDSARAPVLWGYLVENAAKAYCKEFGGTWHAMFSKEAREEDSGDLQIACASASG